MFMAEELQPQVGFLVPLLDNGDENGCVCSIPIFQGSNTIARNTLNVSHLATVDHLLIHASSSNVEITVAGSAGSVTLRSGLEARMLDPQLKTTLLAGDVVELLPGKFSFKYVSCSSYKGKAAAAVDVVSASKRKRQIDEDEAFARALQEMENSESDIHVTGVHVSSKRQAQPPAEASVSMQSASSPFGFQLLRVQGLPDSANSGCVKVSDVIKGDVLVAILSNYMVDIDWLISACPLLRTIPQVVMIHGESDNKQLQVLKPKNWILYKPPLRLSFGTHHSKAMFLVYPTGVRVVVHTANYISVDWNNKSQGLWMQDFPFKSMTGNTEVSRFENDLVEYLTALEWSGCTVDMEHHGSMKINAAYFRNFDYSNATVRLVASVPGYHNGQHLHKWGHMKFRAVLQEESFDQKFQKTPLVCQFSSLGSLDEKWMEEFASSMCEGSTNNESSLGLGPVQIIFPTVEDVRSSLEGYRAGNAIPSPAKNVFKPFLKKHWCRWQAEHTGRSRAMPHIKTYTRYKENCLAWFCLTSANLSKAAWGALQKNRTQLMIRSYELGVVFLPSLLRKCKNIFSCTEETGAFQSQSFEEQNVELCSLTANTVEARLVKLPVPYALPPVPYSGQDAPWCWDRQYSQPDVFGQKWMGL